jgi:hypothetical protein
MTAIDDAAVLERAKRLCEKDGMTWDAEIRPPSGQHKPKVLTISPGGKAKYLATARERLLAERGG